MIERWIGPAASKAAETVLRSLPEWFGLEEPIRGYIRAAGALPTYVATETGTPRGFMTLEQRSPLVREIVVMGVLPQWHRCGYGRDLVAAASDIVRGDGGRMLLVKTLGPSHPSREYARTRAFYEAIGFHSHTETTDVWGETNPCLFMFKPL